MRTPQKEYTRKVDREYQAILMKKTKVGIDWNPEMDLSCLGEANDYLVKEIFWLTQDEVDNLSVNEFDDLLQECNKIKEPNFTKKW